MSEAPLNTPKVLLSIIGGLLTVLFAVSGWVWANQSSRIDVNQVAQERGAERTSRLEGDVAAIQAALSRIENKLDSVIYEKRKER